MSTTDLNGIFNVQQALLNDISTQLSNKNNIEVNNNLYNEVLQMQPDLDNYNTSFQKANQSSAQVLERQNDVMHILDNELDRLSAKQQNVDNALEGKRRGSFLNDNYRERYSHYTKIVFIFILTLVIVYVLNSSKDFIPLPTFVINFIIVIIIVIAVTLCYYNFMTILVRDKIYFDELNLSPPDVTKMDDTTPGKLEDISYSKVSMPGFGLCIDSDCCSTGTVWDPDTYTCVVSKTGESNVSTDVIVGTQGGPPKNSVGGGTEKFTTLDMAYINEDVINIIHKEKPLLISNEANEFVDYTVYN